MSNEKSQTTGQTKNVLVGVDGSEGSRRALDFAFREAKALGLTLRVVNAWHIPWIPLPTGVGAVAMSPQDAQLHSQILLDAMVGQLDDPQMPPITATPVEGNAAEVLIDLAESAELIVVGSRGHGGFARLMLGSVSKQILHHVNCPVVVVHDTDTDQAGHVVVGWDGSEASKRAVRWAATVARRKGVDLEVVHAWHLPTLPATPLGGSITVPDDETLSELEHQASSSLTEEVRQLLTDFADVKARSRSILGSAAWALVEASKGASLAVVGDRGQGGFSRMLLGSVSTQVAEHAQCPVAVIR